LSRNFLTPTLEPPGLPECCIRSASGVAHVGKHVGVDVQTIGLEKTPIVVDEEHVLLPVPVGTRIGMAIDPAARAGGTAGYFRVADYVLAVYGILYFLQHHAESFAEVWYILLVNHSGLSM
jgi:hypothetical protein